MSIMLFPGMIATFLMRASNPLVASAATTVNTLFQNQENVKNLIEYLREPENIGTQRKNLEAKIDNINKFLKKIADIHSQMKKIQ